MALPTHEPPFLRTAKDLSSNLGKNFKIYLKCFYFLEISLKFQSWHARAGNAQFGLDSWLAFSRSALGTRLRAILFSFRCTCRRPGDTRRAIAEAASRFLKNFAQPGFSFRISRFRGSAAPWPANPGQVAFAAELFIFLKKGAALYQHLKRVGNDMKSNICSLNSFSNDRV